MLPVSAADDAIGALIAEAMEKVGKDGVITVEESKTMGTTLEVVEGMQFRQRILLPLHGNCNRKDGSCTGESVYPHH